MSPSRNFVWRAWSLNALALGFLCLTVLIPLLPALQPGAEMIMGLDSAIHLSWEATNRRALSAGQIPHWNPYAFGGFPGLADIQNQVFYPPNVVLRFLPLNQFFAWGIFFHLWLVGAGAFALCRQIGVGRWAATAAAVGLALCGTMPLKVFAGHLVLLYGFSWMPLALALAIRSVERGGRLPHPALVAVLVAQMLAGALQVTVYTYGCLGAYYLFAFVRRQRDTPGRAPAPLVRQAAVLGGLTAGLASFQLLPTARLVLEAGRRAGLTYERATEGSLAWSDLVTAFFPYAFGMQHESWEGGLFVGAGLLVFAPLACWSTKHRRASLLLCLLSVGALLLALGHRLPVYRLHYALLPQFRIPIRVLFFWSMGVAVLGAIGLDLVLRREATTTGRADRVLLWVPAGVALAAAAVGVVAVRAAARSQLPDGTLLGTPLWLVGVGAVTLVSIGVLSRFSVPRVVGMLAVGLVATEGVVFTQRMVTQNSPIGVEVVREIARHEPSRVLSICENVISASDLLRAGIPTTDGFGSIYLDEYARFLNLVGNDTAVERATRLGGARSLPARLDLLDLLNVTHVVTCEPIDSDRFRFVGNAGETRIYENTRARPRAFLTCPVVMRQAGVVAVRLHAAAYDATGRLVGRPPRIEVKWAETLLDEQRTAKARRYSLAAAAIGDAAWWAYDLIDQTPDNVRALLADEAVEDTYRIDPVTARVRQRGEPSNVDDPVFASSPNSGLVGEQPCTVEGSITLDTMDRPNGELRLVVETPTGGLVYLSEPYYSEREAWLDGIRVPIERVNMAFSAVAVPQGQHVVRLQYVPRAFYWGLLVSLLTALCWGTAEWRQRRRSVRPA